MVCLGSEQRSFCHSRLHPSTAFWTLVDYDSYSISSKGFSPTVVDIMVIWVKFTNSSPFYFIDSPGPISCLTTSNLAWFMDPTFQVPVQYCSLQHQILLCWGPAWGISPMTRSCGRKPDKMQGRDQASGVPPGFSWASGPPKIRICLLFHSSDILWKKSHQGFSLLHLKGMFQLNPLW